MQLDVESRAELEAYKVSVTPAAATRDANWEAIARRALRGDAPEWVDEAGVVPRQRHTKAWLLAAGLTAVAASVAMLVTSQAVDRASREVVPTSASYENKAADHSKAVVRDEHVRTLDEHRPQPADLSDGEKASPETEDAGEVAPRAERAPHRRPRSASRAAPRIDDERASDAGDIRVESRLIGHARAALRDGNAAVASRLLDEHARRFPSGELEQERELLRVVALCNAGKIEAAKRAARRFRRAFSGSPLLGHLESTCAEVR